MPITNFTQLARFSDACGAEIPRWIRRRMEGLGDDIEEIRAFGHRVVLDLCRRLLAGGAPGLHFYTSGWDDDLVQLRFPVMPGSSNAVSLQEAQRNFLSYGAAERRCVGQTRTPEVGEGRDPGWRPLDQARDNCEEPAARDRLRRLLPLARHDSPLLLATTLTGGAWLADGRHGRGTGWSRSGGRRVPQ